MSTHPKPTVGYPSAALLEVVVRQPYDVGGAQEGGAGRLYLATPEELSPEPVLVSSVCRETDLPVRVLLRLNDTFTTTGGELTRLVGLAESYLAVGAEGVAFGFLDGDLEIDVEVCDYLAAQLPRVPWTFHRALDSALDTGRAWRDVRGLAELDSVHSAGSPQGLGVGHDDLTDRALADPAMAALLVAAGGLAAEHVPWLVRAGVRGFQVGRSVRPGRSANAYVDARLVRSWRTLIDDAVGHVAASARASG